MLTIHASHRSPKAALDYEYPHTGKQKGSGRGASPKLSQADPFLTPFLPPSTWSSTRRAPKITSNAILLHNNRTRSRGTFAVDIDGTGSYRIHAGKNLYYLIIATNVFDEDTMCRLYLLLPALAKFPDGD